MDSLISSTRRKVIVGLGATGLSVARFLAQRGEEFTVVDTREHPPGLETLRRELPEVTAITGAVPQDLLDTAGELIVSPGISPAEPWLVAAVQAGAVLRGDIDLFMAAAQAPVVGITGSNAKSTVTELLGFMAREAGCRVAVGGNLGTPALDLLAGDTELYVLELSSFQLERAGELGLTLATVLNISPDHLDRHGSMPRYHQAKHRIFAGAQKIVFNADDPLTVPPMADGRKQLSWRLREPELQGFGLREVDGEVYLARGFDTLLPVAELAMSGQHNVANGLAALAMGSALDLPEDTMLRALRTFTGLPHRCELVLEKNDVRWVNDSKATNVGAAVAAIRGLGSDRPLVLIAGGRNKGADLRLLRDAVSEYCPRVLLIGESALELQDALEDCSHVSCVGDLDHAVASAAKDVEAGQTVLLSPACASFDQFASYEARGEAFRRAVWEVVAP